MRLARPLVAPGLHPFPAGARNPLREIFVGADDVAWTFSASFTLCPGERLGADEALRHPYFVKNLRYLEHASRVRPVDY